MLGRRSKQRGLFEADSQYLEKVGKDSFYGFLASLRDELFVDEDFAIFYDELGRGRPSVPPALLATALLLQTYDRVSDREAMERATFDLRWSVALGIEVGEQPFTKSTLQLFRAHLVVHEEAARIFKRSLDLARERGFVVKGKRKMRVALDTTNILGQGAVKDTYNLLADGIVLVLRQLALLAKEELGDYAAERGLGRYVGERSLKGEAEINWDRKKEREGFLREIVGDADRLLVEVREARGRLVEGSPEDEGLKQAAERLSQILMQDIERKEEGPQIREGVARDRVPSVHDPEMRHGRKSAQKRFDGHKAQIAVDTESQLITAVDVIAGNAADNTNALALVEESEGNAEAEVSETVADSAYADGATRQQFADADRRLVAKMPAIRNRGRFPKTDFRIDLTKETCICPAGEQGIPRYSRSKEASGERKLRSFRFATEVCATCELRPQCTGSQRGRSVAVHPQESLLQEARAFQETPEFREYQRARQAAEHRLARLVQLGIRQARYRGKIKTVFQLLMAATVANLTLIAGHSQLAGGDSGLPGGGFGAFAAVLFLLGALLIRQRPKNADPPPNRSRRLDAAPPCSDPLRPFKMAHSQPAF
ncbi:MAG: IS1182 family transposase [Dehalococcoidia bacterium]